MEGIEIAVPSVQLTKTLLSYVGDALRLGGNEEVDNELNQVEKEKEGTAVPFRLVRCVFQRLKDAGEDVYLHEMISGSDLVLPGVKFAPRDPELEARVQKLKLVEQAREYKRMTQNVDVSTKQEIRFNEDVKSLNRQMIAVFNFLVTVGGAFAFGYKGVEVAYGAQMFAAQLVTGLVLAGIVFMADLYFLLKYSPQ